MEKQTIEEEIIERFEKRSLEIKAWTDAILKEESRPINKLKRGAKIAFEIVVEAPIVAIITACYVCGYLIKEATK